MDDRLEESMSREIAGMQRGLEISCQEIREYTSVEEVAELRRIVDQHINKAVHSYKANKTRQDSLSTAV